MALTEVTVGTHRIPFRIPLGTWSGQDPPAGGLLGTPVVVVVSAPALAIVERAVSVTGGLRARETEADGRSLLTAAEDVDVLVTDGGNGRTMNVIRALGGRPLPALPLSRPDAIEALLDGCHVDLDLAIPRLDGERRAAVRAALTPLRLDDLHHIVEVDPRAGVGHGSSPTLDDLGAAAAGVLAGRLAAGRRRFLDDPG